MIFTKASLLISILTGVLTLSTTDAASLKLRIADTDKYFFNGEQFTLNCTVSRRSHDAVELDWSAPGSLDAERVQVSDAIESGKVLYKSITVMNARKEDAGNYTCKVSGNVEKLTKNATKIYLDKPFINTTEPFMEEIEADLSKTNINQFKLRIEAYPEPKYTVYFNNNILSDTNKYIFHKLDQTGNVNVMTFMFKIRFLKVQDTGNYSFRFNNGASLEIIRRVIVLDKPKTKIINNEEIYDIGSNVTLSCEAVGYPLPEIQWAFIEEDGLRTPLITSPYVIKSAKDLTSIVSNLTLPVKTSGEIECLAENSQGTAKDIRVFQVYEIPNGFGIKNSNNTWFHEKSTLILQCLASKIDFLREVSWYFNESEIRSNLTDSNYSYIAELRINQIKVEQQGTYYCNATRKNGTVAIEKIDITVAKIQGPTILGPEEESLMKKQLEEVKLTCVAFAVPPPTITWHKDNKPLTEDLIKSESWINSTLLNSTMIISKMQSNYAGKYECVISSDNNKKTKTITLSFTEPTSYKVTYILSICGSIFFVLMLLVTYLTWKIRKEKQLRRELKRAGLLYFNDGQTKSLNPDLRIDEQAELLPYNDKFEFPVEKLTLDKQLGSGAFGVVYLAKAQGLINAEESMTVAVKKVQRTAENMHIKALASELKIMVHLGKHVNIVNLLGACTRNIEKRELIVIVEYCKFGNIHDYLIKHREVFIDQNDNPEETLDRVNRGYTRSIANSAPYSACCGSDQTAHTDHTFIHSATTNRSGRTERESVMKTQSNEAGPSKVSENGYVQHSKSNYEGDYSFDGRSPRPLCTRDLLAWAFQIARGMEYLASRKILHGDLAARNILLAEDNVVKICDFGLARNMYNDGEYRKTGDSPLPVKWLAIECLTDGIFSTQSDVWSFGIVLWELFSLAATPYPNIETKYLVEHLQNGGRLSKPDYADDKLYDVMRWCWHPKPSMRPTFTHLQVALGSMLEKNVHDYYIALNDGYLDLNAKKEGEDYLAMVAAPDYNDMVTPSPQANNFSPPSPNRLQQDAEGYPQKSQVSGKAVYKARPQSTKFHFDAEKLNNEETEENNDGCETTPMLILNNVPRSESESDQEGNVAPCKNMCSKNIEETNDELVVDFVDIEENNAKNSQANDVTNPTYFMITAHARDHEGKPQNTNYLNVPNGLAA